MVKLNYIFALAGLIVNLRVAENKWVWSKHKADEKVGSYYPLADRKDYYAGSLYARADRDREPTTKRPVPGQPQNEDIDDYADTTEERSKQNTPYLPPGVVAGSYNGFGGFPQLGGIGGHAANGILVGPGGPTGIIGRPQAQYPAGSYPGYQLAQNFPGGEVHNNHHGYNVLGQYPQPFVGVQYPSVLYPQQPQYTEGYGLGNLNPGFNINPQFNGNFNPGFGFGFDQYPAPAESKSARIKTIDEKVDDKVTKNFKNAKNI